MTTGRDRLWLYIYAMFSFTLAVSLCCRALAPDDIIPCPNKGMHLDPCVQKDCDSAMYSFTLALSPTSFNWDSWYLPDITDEKVYCKPKRNELVCAWIGAIWMFMHHPNQEEFWWKQRREWKLIAFRKSGVLWYWFQKLCSYLFNLGPPHSPAESL